MFARNVTNCPHLIWSVASGGGAIYSNRHSLMLFEDQSTVTFTDNRAFTEGGAIKVLHQTNFIFHGNSTVSFYRNGAEEGGEIIIRSLPRNGLLGSLKT